MIGIRTKAVAAALTLALVAGGIAIALLAQEPGSATAAATSDASDAPTALPAVAATELKALAPAGTDPAESRRAVSSGHQSVFVTPAPGGICLSLTGLDGATVSCDPRDRVEANAAPPSTKFTGCGFKTPPDREASTPEPGAIRCEAVTVYGLASDDIDAVALEVQSGEAPDVAFANGAYVVDVALSQRPTAVRLVADGRATTLPVDISGFGG